VTASHRTWCLAESIKLQRQRAGDESELGITDDREKLNCSNVTQLSRDGDFEMKRGQRMRVIS
jgi:hypothetical protein